MPLLGEATEAFSFKGKIFDAQGLHAVHTDAATRSRIMHMLPTPPSFKVYRSGLSQSYHCLNQALHRLL